VLDIPGGHGKSPIGPSYARPTPDGRCFEIEDFKGGRHLYPPRAAGA
jgi:lysine 2,3-aminomutase